MGFNRLVINRSSFILATLLLFSALLGIPAYAKEEGKGSYDPDFLNEPEAARIWWYMGTFTMLGHLVSISDKEKGNCIWMWYFKEPRKKRKIIEDTIRSNPKYAPSGVILALLFKDCGEFKVRREK